MELKSSKSLAVTSKRSLTSLEITSQKYHDIFDFKLTKEELFKWQYKNLKETTTGVKNKSRLQREKYSRKKLLIAKRVGKILEKIPTIKFVGITGALAMNNASKNGDIDLMIITKSGYLWITRLISYIFILLAGFKIRSPRKMSEKDKLCLNMWFDENYLVWDRKDRNIYTAHEIAQVIPIVNKDETYENFLSKNNWVLQFWPKAVEIKKIKNNFSISNQNILMGALERVVFKLQFLYMKSKMTREVVALRRAVFHPNDWGKVVLDKLST